MPDSSQPAHACFPSRRAICFGQAVGLMGLEHGGITVEQIGELETKDATRSRIKWYTGLALFSELGAAKLTGITA